jgi:hypothetical protein
MEILKLKIQSKTRGVNPSPREEQNEQNSSKIKKVTFQKAGIEK